MDLFHLVGAAALILLTVSGIIYNTPNSRYLKYDQYLFKVGFVLGVIYLSYMMKLLLTIFPNIPF